MQRDRRSARSKSHRSVKGAKEGAGRRRSPIPSVPAEPGRVEGASEPASLLLLGVPFHNVTARETLDWIVRRARAGAPCQIVTSNLDFVRQASRDPEMHRIHLESDLVLADGVPPVWLSRFFGPPLEERVTGSDLVPSLARAAREHDLSLYAVGAAPGVAEQALRILQERNPGLRISGWESPPLAPLLQMDHDSILANVRKARPDVLLVALGAPKQDKWIRLHLRGWEVPVAIGVGGSLDFLVGTQVRAPVWLQRIGLEWFWRLAGQPRRLFKRYANDLAFLLEMIARLLWIRMFQPVWSARRNDAPEPARLAALQARWLAFPPLRRFEEADAFYRLHEGQARTHSLVLDLSRFSWLNSLELGTLARLAKECRRGGRRLFIADVCPRLRNLAELFQLDRYLELPTSRRELDAELERLQAADRTGEVRMNRAHHRLRVILPREFGLEAAQRTENDFFSHWRTGTVREVVIDAGRLEFIDSSGARFLDETRRRVEQETSGSMWLLGFPKALLDTMRRDGLSSVRIDRRRAFRTEPTR